MKQAKYLLVGVPALLVAALALTPLVRAESGTESVSTNTTTSTETEQTNASEQTSAGTSSTDRRSHAAEVETKRAELQNQLHKIKAENKERLSDARKKACENRADNVNKIIQKRSEQGTKQLAVFTKISDRVQAFVKNKNLTVENYDSLVAAINDKQAAAQAAIDANSATTFDCATASASDPGRLPRTSIDAVRNALKEYRTSIKNLITAVKSSAEKAESTTSSTNKSSEVNQ